MLSRRNLYLIGLGSAVAALGLATLVYTNRDTGRQVKEESISLGERIASEVSIWRKYNVPLSEYIGMKKVRSRLREMDTRDTKKLTEKELVWLMIGMSPEASSIERWEIVGYLESVLAKTENGEGYKHVTLEQAGEIEEALRKVLCDKEEAKLLRATAATIVRNLRLSEDGRFRRCYLEVQADPWGPADGFPWEPADSK